MRDYFKFQAIALNFKELQVDIEHVFSDGGYAFSKVF